MPNERVCTSRHTSLLGGARRRSLFLPSCSDASTTYGRAPSSTTDKTAAALGTIVPGAALPFGRASHPWVGGAPNESDSLASIHTTARQQLRVLHRLYAPHERTQAYRCFQKRAREWKKWIESEVVCTKWMPVQPIAAPFFSGRDRVCVSHTWKYARSSLPSTAACCCWTWTRRWCTRYVADNTTQPLWAQWIRGTGCVTGAFVRRTRCSACSRISSSCRRTKTAGFSESAIPAHGNGATRDW